MAVPGEGSGSGNQMEDASKLLERMNLQDEEVDDLVWEDGIDAMEIKPKWLALGRLLTSKNFSQSALIADMKATWNPTQAVVWRRINANLYTMQFNFLEKVILDKLETWCHIHRLPDGVLRSMKAVENLVSQIGEVQEVQVALPNVFFGEFIRIRVKLDVNKKLTSAIGITKGGETEKYLVNMKKCPIFAMLVA
ncbi:hypothetical protein D1007_21249 [Hordeum vulgare]|nr:hypothetical protein D1007_21249 [Hordeum vulgare]